MTSGDPNDDPRLAQASAWFGELQTRIVAAMEALEVEFAGSDAARQPGRFVLEPCARTDPSGAPGGGGRMAMLRGRLFEKMGVQSWTVHGSFPAEFAGQILGATSDPRFWAAGLSLIAYPWSPQVPTIYMNGRLVRTTRIWFGGGADLTPMLDRRRSADDPDAIAFHAAMRRACERHPGVADATRFREWCDEYFWLKHRNEPRGIGGISFDGLNSAADMKNSAFASDFAFARDVGDGLIPIYSEIVRRNESQPWSHADREERLIRRGRYVEFNLLYDRGMIFGLKTGATLPPSSHPCRPWPVGRRRGSGADR
jgi:coproporphyrinogen III oxidase